MKLIDVKPPSDIHRYSTTMAKRRDGVMVEVVLAWSNDHDTMVIGTIGDTPDDQTWQAVTHDNGALLSVIEGVD